MKTFMHLGDGSGRPSIEALWEGLEANGVSQVGRNSNFADLVTCGGKQASYADLRKQILDRGIPIIFMDLGFIKRANWSHDPDGYFQLCLGDLAKPLEGEFPSDRLEALNVSVEDDRRVEGGKVVIIGQVPEDTQHGMNVDELNEWYLSRYGTLVEDYGIDPERIVFRPHPKAPNGFKPLIGKMEIDMDPQPFATVASEIDFIVTLNSTLFYEATMLGVPVVCSGLAHYKEFASRDPSDIRLLTAEEKEVFLRCASYSQWTIDELREGKFYEALEPLITSKK
jgi:hypothetical protein